MLDMETLQIGLYKMDNLETLDTVLKRLETIIASRRGADPKSSYTAGLLADPARAAKKFGEEAVEAVIAAISGDKDALAGEGADVLYHFLVLLAAADVSLDDVAEKLIAREGRSGLEEKAARQG